MDTSLSDDYLYSWGVQYHLLPFDAVCVGSPDDIIICKKLTNWYMKKLLLEWGLCGDCSKLNVLE